MVNPLSSTLITPQVNIKPAGNSPVEKAAAGFGDMLTSMTKNLNETQAAGDLAIEKLQTGEARHLHEVMIAVEEADVSLRMVVQIRNKALAAYEEIMRMQV